MVQAMDQGAIEGAMDGASGGLWSDGWCKRWKVKGGAMLAASNGSGSEVANYSDCKLSYMVLI